MSTGAYHSQKAMTHFPKLYQNTEPSSYDESVLKLKALIEGAKTMCSGQFATVNMSCKSSCLGCTYVSDSVFDKTEKMSTFKVLHVKMNISKIHKSNEGGIHPVCCLPG